MAEEQAPTLEALESESVADTLASVMQDEGMETVDPMFDTVKETLETSDTVVPEETAEETEGRLRDEQGRFASANAEEESAEEPAPSTENTEKPVLLEPNPEWTPEQHEVFNNLDDSAKEFVLSRAAEADTKAQESQKMAERYTGIEGILAEHRTAWAAKGLDDTAALRSLVTLSVAAENNPAEFVKWFAEGRGLNLAELAGAANEINETGEEDDPYADPEVLALKQELAATRAEIESIKNGFENQSAAANEGQVASEIETFKSAKNEAGSLEHPYFDQVSDFMADLITSAHRRGQEMTLADAYESACRADRDVSAKIESTRKAREASELASKRRGKSTAATRAGASVSGRPAPSEQHTPDTLADQLRSEFDSRGLLDQPLI